MLGLCSLSLPQSPRPSPRLSIGSSVPGASLAWCLLHQCGAMLGDLWESDYFPSCFSAPALTGLPGEALRTKKELALSWEFRTQLFSLEWEGRRVWSCLLRRWNYSGS